MKTIWKNRDIPNDKRERLMKLGFGPLTASLLSTREVTLESESDIDCFLSCELIDLQKPTVLPDMDKVDGILKSITSKNKRALIVGDYDVDGVISTFLIKRLFQQYLGFDVEVFIPNRFEHGYGLNDKSLKAILENHVMKYDIVLILDCGTSNFKEVQKIKDTYENPKVIILDHHIPRQQDISSNADALINPRLNDKSAPYCTGGLAYQLCSHIMGSALEKQNFLPYAAIATVADSCNFEINNRIIVQNGLKLLEKCDDVGLFELLLCSDLDVKNCTEEDVSFRIAPLINAPGRLGNATLVLDLLFSDDIKQAMSIAGRIEDLNNERKILQSKIFDEAVEDIEESNKKNDGCILVYNKNWNVGVVGIVASKISEKYLVPAMCLGYNEGLYKGSARSLEGINIKEVLDGCSEIFNSHGGHEMAAGLSVKNEYLEQAHDIICESLEKYKKKQKNVYESNIYYDMEIPLGKECMINESFCEMIFKMAPFGNGNPNPVFLLSRAKCTGFSPWRSKKGGFVTVEGIGLEFIINQENVKGLKNKNMDILFTVSKSFKDDEEWQLKIMDFDIL